MTERGERSYEIVVEGVAGPAVSPRSTIVTSTFERQRPDWCR